MVMSMLLVQVAEELVKSLLSGEPRFGLANIAQGPTFRLTGVRYPAC